MTSRHSSRRPCFTPRENPELEYAALAAYAIPSLYEKRIGREARDVARYLELAVEARGPVLDYGCGNGRVALALARAGFDVWGVDRSRPMLDDFERRLAAEPYDVVARARIVWGDMREVRLRRRFALVVAPCDTLLHLYTRADVECFLARVKAHMEPGGRFVFDVQAPDFGAQSRRSRWRHYDAMHQILWLFVPGDADRVPLALRQYAPLELETLLCHAGFGARFERVTFRKRETAGRYWVSCRVRRRPAPSARVG